MEMKFKSNYMKEVDEAIQVYYKEIDKAKEAKRKEFEKQFQKLKETILAIEDAIDNSYDEIEQKAREKCESDITKIREKHYKR